MTNDAANNSSAPRPGSSPSFLDGTVAGGTVRAAGPDDAALLHDVAAATFALACPPGTTVEAIAQFIATHLSVERFKGYLADPARDLFLAIVDDEPVGYTMLVTEDPTDPDVAAAVTARPAAELSKVYVLAGFHGSGIAAELIAASVERARDRGAAVLWLGVNQHNPKANRFYEKHGFECVGTKKFLVGDTWEDDFVRALELSSR